jgi:hypothetical protein
MGERLQRILVGTALVIFHATASPALAQYVFLDASGDGLNVWHQYSIGNAGVAGDCLHSGVTSLDVYYVTDKNANGSAATCAFGDTLNIGSYQFILETTGSGTVTATGWTDNMGFTASGIGGGDGTLATAGQEIWVGRAGEFQAPGLYKVGSLSVTILGTPVLSFKSASTNFPQAQTLFGSSCPGLQQDNKIRLGVDIPLASAFPAACSFSIGVTATTWGKIKEQYR